MSISEPPVPPAVFQTQDGAIPAEPRRRMHWVWLAITFLLGIFVIQLHSPLRVNTDAVVILRLTSQLTDGRPYLLDGARPVYPIGVPFVFSLLERVGGANALGFALFNLVCLCIAAGAAWDICDSLGRRKIAPFILLISFSSWVILKHSVLPLTDLPYCAVSLVTAALLERAQLWTGSRRFLLLAMALLGLIGGILFRRVGIAMLPAALFAVRPSRQNLLAMQSVLFASKARVVGVAIVAIALLMAAALAVRYVVYLPDLAFDSLGSAITKQLEGRMRDFGELFFNAPANMFGHFYPLVEFGGALLGFLILLGLWKARRQLHPVHVYLIFYLAIMAVWPYCDARFWIPVLPLLALSVFQAVEPVIRAGAGRCVLYAYLAVYFLAALAATAFTTRITFAGPGFPQRYGSGSYATLYEHAWRGTPPDPSDSIACLLYRYGERKPAKAGF